MVGNGEKTRRITQADEDQIRRALLAIPYNQGMARILLDASIKTFGAKTLGVDTGFNPPRCVGVATLAWKIGSTEITKSIRGAPVAFKRVGDEIIMTCYYGSVVEWTQRLMSDNPNGKGMSLPLVCKRQIKK